jgi:lincosamide and streptogramin A transport system ATP-binding/permease protein
MGVPEEVLFRPFETLSPGEQIKTLIATLFIGGDDFILLDEPTNHLDAAGKQAVTEYLRRKKSFIVVSHDRALLDAACDHIISIGRAGIEVMNGNYSVWAEEKRRRDARESSENEKLAKDVSRLTASTRATKSWSDKVEKTKTGNGPVDRGYIGHKSAKMMKRSKSLEARRQSAVEQKSALLHDVDQAGNLKITPLTHHQNVLAEAVGLRIDYLPDLAEITLRVERGDRIALTGENGSGKSSVLKLFAGENVPHTGTVKTASGLVISYVPQTAPEFRGDLRRFSAEAGVDLTMFFTILRNLGLTREALDSDMSDLSDGMKRKALLARSLCESAHLYIWDEPLNFIDIISREQIEDLIRRYEPTMLFVEHDETFARRVATVSVSLE